MVQRVFTGYRNGAIEVCARAGRTHGHALWNVFCHACKRTWKMRAEVIRRGAKSCGCMRGGSGEENPQAKLTWHRVRNIRRRWAARATVPVSAAALARAYRVSRRLISMVVRGTIWIEHPSARRRPSLAPVPARKG